MKISRKRDRIPILRMPEARPEIIFSAITPPKFPSKIRRWIGKGSETKIIMKDNGLTDPHLGHPVPFITP